jgi:hypothetical protein
LVDAAIGKVVNHPVSLFLLGWQQRQRQLQAA